jgi:hypothetical protein
VRLPLQGGLPTTARPAGPVVEIACDESGFSGTNLLDASTPLIAHASVDLGVDEAVELIAALRSGSRFALQELKSGQFLRESRGSESLEWFLSSLEGRAHVQLVDKEYFLVTRVVDLFLAEPSYAAGTRLSRQQRPAALALYSARGSARRDWDEFVASFVELVRTKRRPQPEGDLLERFFRARDSLAGHQAEARPVAEVLGRLDRTRVWEVVTRLAQDDRSIPPPLEPMLPALAETVLFWSGGRRQVLVTHDEQSALTADRLRRLQRALADSPGPWVVDDEKADVAVSPLAGLVMVDSRDDPRVQVADLLAGLARRSPSDGYGGRLQPYLSPTSLQP